MSSLNSPVIRLQSSSSCLSYDLSPPPSSSLSSDSRHYGLASVPSPHESDLKLYQSFELLLSQGSNYAQQLYSFRSISRAIPMLSGKDVENKAKFDYATFSVLEPEMKKLKEVCAYEEHAQRTFLQVFARLANGGGGGGGGAAATPSEVQTVVRDGLCASLVSLVDVLQKIDNLKDMKACLSNDFARYKRAFAVVRGDLPSSDLVQEDISQLQMFLGNPMYPKMLIMHQLRDGVKNIDGHEDLLIDMLRLCADAVEQNLYCTPEEKFTYLRALPYLIFLVDKPKGGTFNAFKSRKMQLSRLQKIVKSFPIVPEVGDMALTLTLVLSTCPNYEPSKMDAAWGGGTFIDCKANLSYYCLVTHWKTMKEQHAGLLTDFARLCDGEALDGIVARFKGGVGVVVVVDPAAALSASSEVYHVVRSILQALRDWSAHVREMVAWKYTHPASDEDVKERAREDAQAGGGIDGDGGGDDGSSSSNNNNNNGGGNNARSKVGSEYERAIRYNYSHEEKSVLVDCISMIKSLSDLLEERDVKLAPVIRMYMHSYVQRFAGKDLETIIKKADDKGRPMLGFLKKVQELAADWVGTTAAAAGGGGGRGGVRRRRRRKGKGGKAQ